MVGPSFRAQRGISLCIFLLLGFATTSFAQVQTGTPPFGSYSGGPDVINLANLNSHLTIPVLRKPGRGTNFSYDLSYDSSVWYPGIAGGITTWEPVFNSGWTGTIPTTVGYASYKVLNTSCRYFDPNLKRYITEYYTDYNSWTYIDPFGVPHRMAGDVQDGGAADCGPPTSTTVGTVDGTGYKMAIDGGPDATLITPTGGVSGLPLGGPAPGGSSTDRNGNIVSTDGTGHFYDTLSSTVAALTLTGSGTTSSPIKLAYTAPSGSAAYYTVSYVAYTVATNFAVSGISEYGAHAVNLVDKITLPDNTFYQFAYEQTPSTPSSGACVPLSGTYQTNCVTARIASVTLPTTGQILYTYTGGAGTNGSGIWSDGSAATLQRQTPDGTWIYAQAKGTGAASITTITDPQSNVTKIQFQGIYETQRDVNQGSGTLLSTINTCYNLATSPCNSTAITLPILNRTVISTIPSAGSASLVAKTASTYNSVGVPTEVDAYAFGSSAPPSTPTTKTIISYAPLGNITAFRQTVTVQSGSGATLSQTSNNYDETNPIGAPAGTPQLTSVTGSRGNLTSVQRCTNLSSCSSSYLQTTMSYDTAGQLQSVTDPLLNKTTFAYTDQFDDDTGTNPAPAAHAALGYPTDAFVTSIKLPTNNTTGFRYYFYSGQISTSIDQNGNSSYSHFQDILSRPTSAYGPSVPIGGTSTNVRPWSLVQYTSSTQVDTFTDINDSSVTPLTSCPSTNSCRQDRVNLDLLGRQLTATLVSDPEGQTKADTVYDTRGQVKTVSHAYRSTGDVTYGLETPSYDALGRTIKVTHPDGTYSTTAYGASVSGTLVNTAQLCSSSIYGLGYPTLFTDESGRQREIWTDAFGRTIEGDEPDSNGSLANSATCYSYDPLGNLLSVVHGSQTRSYAYDALSRTTSVTIPEWANSTRANCPVTFTYDSNSNVQTRVAPTPNQNTSCTNTVTTTYTYDSLNRLTKISYGTTSPVTPTVQYAYDGNSLSSCATTTTPPALTDSNKLGQRTATCDGSGATSWAHDAMGRIITEKRIINSSSNVTQTTSYAYNLDSSIYSVTYPSGKTLNYTVSNAQRLTAVKDSATGGPQFVYNASYAAPGGVQSLIAGQVSGFTGITESHTYNQSLEYTGTSATSTVGTAMNLTLGYNLKNGSANGDNGTVTTITNAADNGRTQTLTYDPLNRISSATSQATSGTDCWGQNFAPDSLANLNTITTAQCSSYPLSVTVDANNHINSSTSYAYDASGNMTADGQTGISYSFDAENRLVKVTGVTNGPWCYFYDGNGFRVAKKSGAASDCSGGTFQKLYWRSLSGDTLTETDGTGSVTANYTEYVFFAGRRIASRVTGSASANTALYYYFADQLGSTRTITTGSGKNNDGSSQTPGQLCYDADFTPYGQEMQHTERLQTAVCPPNYRFTGYEFDSETGLSYAFARYYSPRLGRFLSTDRLGGSVGSLQSHNAYAYTLNNPTNLTDPSGLHFIDCTWYGTCGSNTMGAWWPNGPGPQSPFFLFNCAFSMMTLVPIEHFYWTLEGFFCGAGSGYQPYSNNDTTGGGGRSDRIANMVMISNLKFRLSQIFKNNQPCADLFGGTERAISTLGKMNVVDVRDSPPVSANPWNQGAWNNVSSGNNPASTGWLFPPNQVIGWNGGSFNTYIGADFANLQQNQQLGTLAHEMAHPTTGYPTNYANGVIDQPDSPYSPENLTQNCIDQ